MTETEKTKIHLAIIGCGMIGHVHAQRLQTDPQVRITRLCDSDPKTAERLRVELAPEARVFRSVSELLDWDEPLDGVVICTPTSFHFDQILACHARGVHVLCEKPLADTRERLAELIRRTGGDAQSPILSVAYQRRFDANYRTLRREIRSGRWGRVRSITSQNMERWQQTIAGTWRDDPQINPWGFIGDAGSHKIDMLFFITGLTPLEVFAHSDTCGSRVPIVTTVSARMTGGTALGINFIGNAQHWREDLHIHCEEADLMIREGTVWIARNNEFEKFTALEPGSTPDAGFVDLLRAQSARASAANGLAAAVNHAPADCALPVFDFTRAVLESARIGRPVTF